MLPNMFKLLFGGTPGLASRSALGDVKFLISRSGLDFRLLSAMIYCVEFCGAFGTAIFFSPLFSPVCSSSLRRRLLLLCRRRCRFLRRRQSFSLSTASSSCFPSCLLTKLSILTSRSSSREDTPPAPPPPGLNNSARDARFRVKKSRHGWVERLSSPRRSRRRLVCWFLCRHCLLLLSLWSRCYSSRSSSSRDRLCFCLDCCFLISRRCVRRQQMVLSVLLLLLRL